jgi:hypothetical protein
MNIKLDAGNDSNSSFALINGNKMTPVSLVANKGVDTIKGKIQHTPNKSKERDVLYVSGQSGSGKSHYVVEYVKSYKKMFPKRDIYLFTTVHDVSTIDKIPKLKKIKTFSEEFMTLPFILEDFKDSLVIFDDIDSIADKQLKAKMFYCINEVLTKGRHTNTSCIVTMHVATAGHDTKLILNESNSITIFPASCGGKTLKYLLDGYLGLSKDEIKRVKQLDSRAVTILKTYPKVVLSEKEAFILRNN